MTKRDKPTWHQIVAAYHSLPEDERTALNVAAQVNDGEWRARTGLVSEVLKATVLEERISENDLRITAQVLRTLVDFSRTWECNDSFSDGVERVAREITRGLERIGTNGSYPQLAYEVYLCLGHMLVMLEEHRQILEEYYSSKGPRPRYILPPSPSDNDIPF
jgi:hypothetical protein